MKKIVIILSLIGFNHCFGVYKSEDILQAIENNDISYFEEAVKDKYFNPNQILEKKSGSMSLFKAIRYDRKKIFNLLLECKNIDVNHRATNGSFPLMFACLYKKMYNVSRDYFIKKLLEHKDIEVNMLDQEGLSSFFVVIIEKDLHNLVPLFLNHPNIDLKIKDKDGGTAYNLAKKLTFDTNDVAYNTVALAILKAQNKLKNKKEYLES